MPRKVPALTHDFANPFVTKVGDKKAKLLSQWESESRKPRVLLVE